MKFVISNGQGIQQFSTILGNAKQFLETITCHFKEDGMYFRGLDHTHSCMIECALNKDWFDVYEYDDDEDVALASFNAAVIQKVLKARHESQEIEIEIEGESDSLLISFTKGNNFNKIFEIPLMNVDNQNMEMQEADTDVDLMMDSKKMEVLTTNLVNFNDDLKMNFTEEKIIFTANGLDGSMSVEIDFDDVTEYAVGENTELTQTFNLKMLNQMCAFSGLTEEMKIGFSNGRPMSLKYTIGEESHLLFYLAPKVDE
jgi:proliferating cell nuclear antigen